MDLLEAHGRLAGMDRSCVPVEVVIRGKRGEVDAWPAYATALASLSGWLEEASTDDDLVDAVLHGWTLLNEEIIDADVVADATAEVIAALVKWGRACSTGSRSDSGRSKPRPRAETP